MHKAAVLSWIAPLLVIACDGAAQEPAAPPTQQRVQLSFGNASHHDDPIVSKVLVTLKRIEVYARASRSWITVADYGGHGRPIDLLALTSDNPQGVGALELPAGRYDELRLHVREQGTIEVDEREGDGPVTKPLEVRAGDRTGIRVKDRFDVVGQGLTQVGLEFDARHSIDRRRRHVHGPHHGHPDHEYTYSLDADLDVTGATTTPTSAVAVSAARGGEVHLLGRAGLVIPPGALREDTTIEISVAEIAPSMATRAGVLPGNAVKLEPSGLTFDLPVELTLFYDPAVLPAGRTAAGFGIVSRHPGESWESHPSVAAPDAFLHTAPISHFSIATLAAEIDVICPPGTARLGQRLCTPASTVRTSCASSRDISVKLYDAGGDELSLRDVLWQSSSTNHADIAPRVIDCSPFTAEETCDQHQGCIFDGADCLEDQRFKTIVRTGCGPSTFQALPSAEVPGVPVPGKAVFPVDTKDNFTGTLHTIAIHDDADDIEEGEIYWLFKIGPQDVSDHPEPVDVNSGESIQVNATVSLGSWCEGETTDFVTKLGDEDGFEADPICDKHHPETPFRRGRQELSARCETPPGFPFPGLIGPYGTFHFTITCVE